MSADEIVNLRDSLKEAPELRSLLKAQVEDD
jgi:hypothetical protein